MGLLDILKKQEKPAVTFATVKAGDWVTQFSAGYWKVLRIIPKYADEDCRTDGRIWKKGDRIGDWVILKKGFTPKMKPANCCEFVDALWCKPVSPDISQAIEAILAENPKIRQKFEAAPDMPKPSVASIWLTLSAAQAEDLSRLLAGLPERFTDQEFWSLAADYRQYRADPAQATHIVYLYSYLWEISDTFDPLHFGPEIKKL